MGVVTPIHRNLRPGWQRRSEIRHINHLRRKRRNNQWQPPVILLTLSIGLGSLGASWSRLLRLLPPNYVQMENLPHDFPRCGTSSYIR